MRAFGQTMRSFKIVKSPAGRIFIYAPIRDRDTSRIMGYTFREFVLATGELHLTPHCDSMSEIQNYIKEN
jgi:hypothetical protein